MLDAASGAHVGAAVFPRASVGGQGVVWQGGFDGDEKAVPTAVSECIADLRGQ